MAARLNPTALAMGPDGVLHILHSNNQSIGPGGRVFRLEADGYLRLVAGCATSTCTATVGMDAKTVNLKGGAMSNYSLAVSPSGTVYFAGRIGPANYALRQRTMRVDGDGLLQVLFDGDAPYVEGEVAAQVPLTPSGLAFGENTLVVAEQYNTSCHQHRQGRWGARSRRACSLSLG